MEPREAIVMIVGDPIKLTLLKSKYNRYVTRLNTLKFKKPSEEYKFILDEIKVLKKQIDQYNQEYNLL